MALRSSDGRGPETVSESRAIGEGQTARAVLQRLEEVSTAEQSTIILEMVHVEIAAVLGVALPQQMTPDQTFRDLGFDSLQAVRLRNRLEAAIGLRLPATIVFDYPTPRLVASWVLDQLLGESRPPVASADWVLARIEQLLQAQVLSETDWRDVSRRLPALLARRKGDESGPIESDLDQATTENIFDLVDRELGGR
jgi:acyl carrier protein